MKRTGLSLMVAVFSLAFGTGCMSDLRKQQHTLNTKERMVNREFGVVVKAYRSGANEMASKKHELQRLHLERDWNDFMRIHTNKAGRMVSLDAAGNEVPLSATDLALAMKARDDKMLAIRGSEASWKAFDEPIGGAIDKFLAMQDVAQTTDDNILATEESAQAWADRVLGALGGLAAGAGIASGL